MLESEKTRKPQNCHNHHQVLQKILYEHFGEDANVTGIDIGTNCGDSARSMLWALNNAKIYTMDPWIHTDGAEFEAGELQPYHDGNKALALHKLEPFGDRVKVMEMTSKEAYEQLKNDKYDFVWIDGDHQLEGFILDLELYKPLVKEGGILGGHDFGQVWGLTKHIFDNHSGKLWSGPDFTWWVYI